MEPRFLRPWSRSLLILLIAALLLPNAAMRPAAASPGETRLVVLSKLDGPALPPGLAIVHDYGSFVLARVSDAQLAALPESNVADRMDDRTVISLNGRVWDTARGEPAIPANLRSSASDPYFLVQFQGPIATEWIEVLKSAGATILGYHPNYTYLVRCDPALLPRLRALSAVQWVGRYHPAYRLATDEEMTHALTEGDRLAVEVLAFESEDNATLRSRLESTGATVILIENDPPEARVWATREQLTALAALPNAYRVEPYDPPRLVNDAAAQVMGTSDLRKASRNGLLQDLMGAGQTVGLVDSGLDNKTTSPNIEDFFDYSGGVHQPRGLQRQQRRLHRSLRLHGHRRHLQRRPRHPRSRHNGGQRLPLPDAARPHCLGHRRRSFVRLWLCRRPGPRGPHRRSSYLRQRRRPVHLCSDRLDHALQPGRPRRQQLLGQLHHHLRRQRPHRRLCDVDLPGLSHRCLGRQRWPRP